MEHKDTYEANERKFLELDERKQWAGLQLLRECWARKWYFRVSEVYRSPSRQAYLYYVVRPRVTWTLNSLHVQRLAADVYPINCTYEQIMSIASKYGVTRPLARAPYYDLGHLEFDKVTDQVRVVVEDPETRLKKLQNALRRANETRKKVLTRAIERVRKILEGR